MNEFTIKIDLSNFFKDERKRSLFLVDPKWKEVSDLAKRIETIFQLTDIQFLTEDGCYVPLLEPIRVISAEKTLKAFVFDIISSHKTSHNVKKRKFFSLDDVESCSTPYEVSKCKRSKSLKTQLNENHTDIYVEVKENEIPQDKSCNKENEELSSSQEKIDSSNNSMRKASKKNKCAASGKILLNDLVNVQSMNETSSKSSSKSTKKNKTNSFLNEPFVLREEGKLPIVVAQTESQDNGNQSTQHIHFDDNQENEIDLDGQHHDDNNIIANDYTMINDYTLIKESPTNILFRCALMEQPNTTRIFDLRPKPNVEILEDIRILPVDNSFLAATINSAEQSKTPIVAQEYSLCEQSGYVSSVILLDDTKTDESSRAFIDASVMQTSSHLVDAEGGDDNINEMQVMLNKSEPLTTLPSVGDTLLFKLVENEILTDFITGYCEYVNQRSKLITVLLMNVPKGTERILDKFCAVVDNSNSNLEKVILKFSQMIDLRVVMIDQ